MNGSEFKAALRQGSRVYGTMFVQTRANRGDERLSELGLDYLIVDNEHAPYNRAETFALVLVELAPPDQILNG